MPRQVDHEQRRREIAFGVWSVMADRGLPAVSLRSVANAAGVSMGRVQHYFGSKDALVHHAASTIAELALQAYETPGAASPQERLRRLVTLGLPSSEESRIGTSVWYAFITAAATDAGLTEIVRDSWAGMITEIESLLGEAAAAGGLAAGVDPADTAILLAALQDGLILRLMLGAITLEEARESVERRLDGLFTTPA